MKQADYLQQFQTEVQQMFETTSRKNSDYANANNAFANFTLIESLTGGEVKTEQGILVRMSDKMSRIGNLLHKEGNVKDEAVEDTLQDLAVYAMILKIYLQWKKTQSLPF
jgi:hypothetical protein